jgi:hypothetical protein
MRQILKHIFTDLKTSGWVNKGVYYNYNILINFRVLMNLGRLTYTHLNEAYSKCNIGKYFPYTFTIQNGLK